MLFSAVFFKKIKINNRSNVLVVGFLLLEQYVILISLQYFYLFKSIPHCSMKRQLFHFIAITNVNNAVKCYYSFPPIGPNPQDIKAYVIIRGPLFGQSGTILWFVHIVSHKSPTGKTCKL